MIVGILVLMLFAICFFDVLYIHVFEVLQYFLSILGPPYGSSIPTDSVIPPYVTFLSQNTTVCCNDFAAVLTRILVAVYVVPTWAFEKKKLIGSLQPDLTSQALICPFTPTPFMNT